MINISKTPQILTFEKNDLSVSEFVIGQRFSIKVDRKQITFEQDIEYNKNKFNKLLNLDEIMKILNNVYAFDVERSQIAPTNEYTLECIYYDSDLMKDMLQVYKNKGIIIVGVVLKNNSYVPHGKMKSFCYNLGIPALAPMFVGTSDMIRDRFAILKSSSDLSFNKLSGGLVIRNEPCVRDKITDKPIIWYVEPDLSTSNVENVDSPISMAHEFAFQTLKKEIIEDFIKSTGLDPIKEKRTFKSTLFDFLKSNFSQTYDEYKNRCLYFLGSEKPENKFDLLIKKEITYYVNNILLKTNTYINRK